MSTSSESISPAEVRPERVGLRLVTAAIGVAAIALALWLAHKQNGSVTDPGNLARYPCPEIWQKPDSSLCFHAMTQQAGRATALAASGVLVLLVAVRLGTMTVRDWQRRIPLSVIAGAIVLSLVFAAIAVGPSGSGFATRIFRDALVPAVLIPPVLTAATIEYRLARTKLGAIGIAVAIGLVEAIPLLLFIARLSVGWND